MRAPVRSPQKADVTKVAAAKRRRLAMVNAIAPDGYVHLSGQGYTRSRDLAWSGTHDQLRRLCERFGHDPSKISTIDVDTVI